MPKKIDDGLYEDIHRGETVVWHVIKWPGGGNILIPDRLLVRIAELYHGKKET